MAANRKVSDRFKFKRKALSRLFLPRFRAFKLVALRFFVRFIPNESQRVFALTLLVGALCGLAAVAFHLAIIAVEGFLIEPAMASSHYLWLGILTPVLGGLICGALLTYISPGSRGSGVPQVKIAYGIKGGRMPFKDAVGKFIISALQIGSGASLGREGPTVHICAGISSWLGQTFALSQRNLKRLLPVGVAAGIAAAFNAPIAAVTFTIEEVVGDLDQTVLSGVIVAAAISAAIERSILGEHPVFAITQTYGLHYASSVLFYAILGIAAGFAALVFTESLLFLRAWFSRLKTLPEWMHPAVGAGVTGILAVVAIYFLKTGGITGGGYDILSLALSGTLAFKVMAVLCLMKIAATVFSYGSGGAGGIFAPALFVGGMLGGVIGLLDVNLLGHSNNEIGAFALVGMGAVFAGVIRAPITSVLIIFEMTGSYGLIVPLMIANMTAYGLARKFRPVPIYEALLEQDDIFLPHPSKKGIGQALDQISVASAIRRSPETLPAGITVAEAYERVRDQEFTTFPVVDEKDRCVGMVTEMRLRRTLVDNEGSMTVRSIALKPQTIFSDQSLSKAVLKMSDSRIRQLAVIERGEERTLVGIITMSDIVRSQAEAIKERGNIDVTITN